LGVLALVIASLGLDRGRIVVCTRWEPSLCCISWKYRCCCPCLAGIDGWPRGNPVDRYRFCSSQCYGVRYIFL